ncbi:restriction endonuclease [Mariniphaga sp.]|uniref:restriction endonuclease n=1 Tax=Mariniphaga sp. TaxID=1954475 RepID=UPI0035666673
MYKVKFADRYYTSELSRNRDAYFNESHLIGVLKLEERRKTKNGLAFALCTGAIIGLTYSSWTIAIIISTVIAIFIWIIVRSFIEKQINLVTEYAEVYYENMIRLQRDLNHEVIEPFFKRYITIDQIDEKIPNLVNYINHREKLNLIDDDIKLMIENYEWEKFEEKINNSIAKLDKITTTNIAKMLLERFPNINFDNHNEINELLESFENFQKDNKRYCDIDILEKEIFSQYKVQQAIEFGKKLNRNNSNRLTIAEVENMDGFEFEDFLAELYRKAGYKVHITSKSGDQGADLIIEKDGINIAVQAKKYSGKVTNKAVQEVVAAMKYYDCDKAIVITTGYFTKSAIELADRNNVILKDQKSLNILIDSIL